jgi:Holliday junction DNA helicase RuvA
MIGYLQGEVLQCSEGKLLVGVGERQSFGVIGYLLSVPQRSQYLTFLAKTRVELHIYTHVREDALDLFGFLTPFEKELFLALLTVNGVGPKSALGILSSVEPFALVNAILKADQTALTKIAGIGKKTAERVVLELKDVVRKKVDLGLWTGPSHDSLAASGALSLSEFAQEQGAELKQGNSQVFQDAKSALVGLGYRDHDIHLLLNRILDSGDTPPRAVEDLVRSALRQLA